MGIPPDDFLRTAFGGLRLVILAACAEQPRTRREIRLWLGEHAIEASNQLVGGHILTLARAGLLQPAGAVDQPKLPGPSAQRWTADVRWLEIADMLEAIHRTYREHQED